MRLNYLLEVFVIARFIVGDRQISVTRFVDPIIGLSERFFGNLV